jgi:hypothetical protein
VGNFWDVATFLANSGFEVIATDVKKLSPPEGVSFYMDDITNPRMEIYKGAALIYSIRPPPELFKYIVGVSINVGSDCIIKPIQNEFPEREEKCNLVNYKGLSFYVWKRPRKYDKDYQR